MSAIHTIGASPLDWRPTERRAQAATPAWLRPAATAVIVGLHVAALMAPRGTPVPTPLDAIEVTMVAEGEAVSQAASASTAAMDAPPDDMPPETETAPPIAPPPTPLDIAPPIAAPPPVVAAPDPVVVPVALPEPVAPPPPLPIKTSKPVDPAIEKAARVEQDRKKRDDKLRKLHQQQAAAAAAAKAKTGASAQKAGVHGGMAQATGSSIASYGALVRSEVQSHKFYPPAARAVGATGTVGVQFSVTASGHVARASVIRSSGNGALDAAARQIVMSIHPPPPPGGAFEGSTSINFGT